MDQNYFCNQPWKYRVINISQEWYKFCCVSPSFPISSIDKVETHPILLNVKKSLLENTPPKECSYCFNLEKDGSSSYRTVVAETDKTKLQAGLAVIEINLENTCNLRCSMCDPKYSSRWKNNIIEIVENETALKNVNHTIDLIKQNSSTLMRVIISGGEPSIIPNFYRLIDSIATSLPKTAWIYINTNGMFNERLGGKFLSTIQELSKTHNVLLYWSCDGFAEVGEFLRDGLEYEKFKSNMRMMMSETTAHHTLQITTTHMNLHSQIDLIEDLYNTVGKVSVKKLFTVIGKEFMHPKILGNRIKKIVTEEDISRIALLAPEYAIAYTDLIEKVSNQDPDQKLIQFSNTWFEHYAKSIKREIPTKLKYQFNIMSEL
jgi:organic radical activating enzyme